jgi:hypothetical protein
MFAKIALDDLRGLSSLKQRENPRWQRLADDIELLHEVAREHASVELDRVRA